MTKRRLKDIFFYWDERSNFGRTRDVHFRSRADWESHLFSSTLQASHYSESNPRG